MGLARDFCWAIAACISRMRCSVARRCCSIASQLWDVAFFGLSLASASTISMMSLISNSIYDLFPSDGLAMDSRMVVSAWMLRSL